MSYITLHKDTEVRRVIRDAQFLNPLISYRQLQKILEDRFKKSFDNKYVLNLRRKVHLEIRHELDQKKVGDRIGEYREFVRMAKESLLRIAHDEKSSNKDKKEAWATMGVLEKNLLEAEFDAGIYERKLGTVDHKVILIDPARAAQMARAFQLWTLQGPQARKIEVRDAVTVETTDITAKAKMDDSGAKSRKPQPLPTDRGPVLEGQNGSAIIVPAKVVQPRISANSDGTITITPRT